MIDRVLYVVAYIMSRIILLMLFLLAVLAIITVVYMFYIKIGIWQTVGGIVFVALGTLGLIYLAEEE